jgi:hypothetical protein
MIAELGAVRTGFLTDGAMAFAQNRISDYEAGAVKATTDFARHGHGTQLGDVVKSAQLICDVADAPDLPLHLPVGPDAVGAIESRAEPFEEPLRLWRDRAMATGHAEGGSGAARV